MEIKDQDKNTTEELEYSKEEMKELFKKAKQNPTMKPAEIFYPKIYYKIKKLLSRYLDNSK